MRERTTLARAVGREERQLASSRVRADERERIGPVDHVHAEMRREEADDRVAVGNPVRDVVELRRVHSLDGTEIAMGYAALFAPVDRALELLLRHPRAPLDPHPLR